MSADKQVALTLILLTGMLVFPGRAEDDVAPSPVSDQPAEAAEPSSPDCRLEQARETIRAGLADMQRIRREQLAREMTLRRQQADIVEIVKQIEALTAEIRQLEKTLNDYFRRDPEWQDLQSSVAEAEATVNEARGELLEMVRTARRQAFKEREAAVTPPVQLKESNP